MTRYRRKVAGQPFPGRERLTVAPARQAMSEQTLINFIALAPFSGDAWTARYRDRPRPVPVIPQQRRPHQTRWDAYVSSSYGAARHGHPPYGAAAETARRRQARD